MTIKEILQQGSPKDLLSLFQFSPETTDEKILVKLNLFSRKFYPQYFESEDADFHDEMNMNMIKAYKGTIDSFVNLAFRGAGKDVKTKLFIVFVILNDRTHFRKFFKILSADLTNAKQMSTDIYNMLVYPSIQALYPDTFAKSDFKREETMASFTTNTGIKLLADTVGTEQRGAIQEASRPDFIVFNDFESRKTLRSSVITRAIADNMEEARTGLQKGGVCLYLANYVSELGNVHKLVTEHLSPSKVVLNTPISLNACITPIIPTWNRYTVNDIQKMIENDEDFDGERLGKPSSAKDVYFDRDMLDKMPVKQPIKTIGGFKMFKEYNALHRYAGGHDVAGGVGLDSSTSVFIDFDTIPAQVVATYKSNTILPEAFGEEIYNQSNRFGGCLIAPENNKYDQTILKARQLGAKLYTSVGRIIKIHSVTPNTFGWNTNSLTKSTMMSSAREAIESGLVELNDIDLINEAKAYSLNDLIDKPTDIRLTTRHFDLLTAFAIAWQMKNHTRPSRVMKDWTVEDLKEVNEAI